MKASPVEQKELLRLQALDTKVRQLEHQTTSLSQHGQLRELGTTADAARAALAARSGERDDVRSELRRIESDVEVVEKRITRDTDRVQHTSSVKDIQALETELTALRKRLSDLEEIEIAVMERLEEQDAIVAAGAMDRDEIAARVLEVEQARDGELIELRRQLGELGRDRAAMVAAIPTELAALYEKRLVAGRGNAAALLRARTCSGCTMTLTGSDLESVRLAPVDEVVYCPDCGAVLVRTEESGI